MSITGDRIKELRLRNDWTQEELGEKLGLKKAAINKYELGIVENIKRQTLLDLAEVLGTTPNYLMGWEDELIDPDSNTDVFSAIGHEIKIKKIDSSPLYKNLNRSKEDVDLVLNGEEDDHACFVIKFLKLLNIDPNSFFKKYGIEKWRAHHFMNEYKIQFEDSTTYELNKTEVILIEAFNKLNDLGKKEAITRVNELIFIPRYRTENLEQLNAAHEIAGASEEDKQYDEDIMDDEDF